MPGTLRPAQVLDILALYNLLGSWEQHCDAGGLPNHFVQSTHGRVSKHL